MLELPTLSLAASRKLKVLFLFHHVSFPQYTGGQTGAKPDGSRADGGEGLLGTPSSSGQGCGSGGAGPAVSLGVPRASPSRLGTSPSRGAGCRAATGLSVPSPVPALPWGYGRRCSHTTWRISNSSYGRVREAHRYQYAVAQQGPRYVTSGCAITR